MRIIIVYGNLGCRNASAVGGKAREGEGVAPEKYADVFFCISCQREIVSFYIVSGAFKYLFYVAIRLSISTLRNGV